MAQNYGESYALYLCTGAGITLISQKWRFSWLCHGHYFCHPGWWQKHSSKWLPAQQMQTRWDQRQRSVEWVSCGGNIWQPYLCAQVRHALWMSTSPLWTLRGRSRDLLSQGWKLWANWCIIWPKSLHSTPKFPLSNDRYTNYCLKYECNVLWHNHISTKVLRYFIRSIWKICKPKISYIIKG